MKTIATRLDDLEKEKSIRILFACETGSRAWGFHSPDSDYDVRFIYMHDRDWYLSLSDKKDSLEVMDGDLDITGWDLRKCLKMLKKSNASLIERFQSPIGYREVPGFADDFRKLIREYYSPTAVFFHHYSLATKFREELKDRKEIRLKSLFYLIRSVLSCNWIVEDKMVLPMHIEGLMQKIGTDEREKLRELIQLKAGVGEKYLHPHDAAIDGWMELLWEKIETSKQNLGVCKTGFTPLNEFFLKMVNEYADDRTGER